MDEVIAKFIEKTCGFPELVPQLGKTRRTISKMPTHTHNGIHKGGPAAEGGRPTFVIIKPQTALARSFAGRKQGAAHGERGGG